MWTAGVGNVAVLYEHGRRSPEAPVKRAGIRLAKSVLLPSPLTADERATAVFTDIGGYRLTLPGRDGPTGLPDVDAVLDQFGRLSGRIGFVPSGLRVLSGGSTL